MAKPSGYVSKPSPGMSYKPTAGITKAVKVNDQQTISQAQEDKLAEYLRTRIGASYNVKSANIARFREIDKELAGHIVPSDDDKKRIRDNKLGKGPKTYDENIQFALMQLNEAVTYVLGVYAPESGMYTAVTDSENQEVANAVTVLMNKHSKHYKHYRNTSKSVLDQFKYNLGGAMIEWDVTRGKKIVGNIKAGQVDSPEVDLDAVLTSGNILKAFDPYNFVYDPGVNPLNVSEKGEFAGEVELIRDFDFKMKEQNGFYFNCDRWNTDNYSVKFYEEKPTITHAYVSGSGGMLNNWDSYLSNTYGIVPAQEENNYQSKMIERCVIHCWIRPADFGLGKDNKYQIWRFHIINNEYIARADQMLNVFNKLPYIVGMPNEDGLDLQSRTFAEMLLPFQRFASAQFNIKTRADRKRLYGTTIYNRRVIPLFDVGALEGGLVAASPAGEDYDLNKAVKQFTDVPDTTNIMKDINDNLGLMKQMLPSTQSSQVANLERATKYQAAAYVQASSRRNLYIASLMDDQCYEPGRQMQLSNIKQFGESVDLVDPETKKKVAVDIAAIRTAELDFAIGDGLKGLDKVGLSTSMQEVINMLLQSQVAKDYDIGRFINYFFQLQGDKMDFTEFKWPTPFDALTDEQKQLAFALLQKAAQQQQGQAQQQSLPPGQAGQPGQAAPQAPPIPGQVG